MTHVAKRELAYTGTGAFSQNQTWTRLKLGLTFCDNEMKRHENEVFLHGEPLSKE